MTRDITAMTLCAVVLFGQSMGAQTGPVSETPPPPPINASTQKGDPVWDGAVWGAAIGVVTGTVTLPGYLLYNAVGADNCRSGPRLQCAAAMGAIFVGVGLLIDWMRNGQPGPSRPLEPRKAIVRVAPEVTPNYRAIRLTWSF